MQTGAGCGYWNVPSFIAFSTAIAKPEGLMKYAKKYPQFWINACDGLFRRAPVSYTYGNSLVFIF